MAETGSRPSLGDAVAATASRYLEALASGDRHGARAAVDAGLERGVGLPALVLEVLAPAQRAIGARWLRGDLSVAQEHWATEVTAAELGRLRQAFPPRRELGLRLVVAAPEGERHVLAPACLAALFAWRGWQVDLLGGDVPGPDLASFVAERQPAVVALSVTLEDRLAAAAAAVRALAALPAPPHVIVGGAAFGDPAALPAALAPAQLAASAPGGLQLAEELATPGSGGDLAAYLSLVGRRIHELRRRRGLSQAGLGEAAALTRSYLSAVEQGRQNITLDAALRLARALRVPVGELLGEEG